MSWGSHVDERRCGTQHTHLPAVGSRLTQSSSFTPDSPTHRDCCYSHQPARQGRGRVSPVLFTSVGKSLMTLCPMHTPWAHTGEARESTQHEPVQEQVLHYLREPCSHTDPT